MLGMLHQHFRMIATLSAIQPTGYPLEAQAQYQLLAPLNGHRSPGANINQAASGVDRTGRSKAFRKARLQRRSLCQTRLPRSR